MNRTQTLPVKVTIAAPSTRKVLLPESANPDMVGGRWIARAVSLTLGLFALLLTAATLAAVMIRMKVTVDGAGVLQPAQVWSVRGEATGVVRDVRVRMGDTVRAGQPIARLDTVQLSSELDQLRSRRRVGELDLRLARTSLPLEARSVAERSAEADADLVRANAELRQRLVEHGFDQDVQAVRRTYRVGTNVAVDGALAAVMTAEAAARTARIEAERLGLKSIEESRQRELMAEIDVQIATLEQRLSRLTLYAPANGIVLTDGLERLSGKVLQEGETLLEIGGDHDWRAALLVPERDVSRIRVGDDVQVEITAFGRVNAPEIRGKVLTVGAEPAPDAPQAGNRMFPVMVRLDRGDLEAVGLERLRRGYTANARIVTRSERLIDLIWEYLLRRTERKRVEPAQPPAPAPAQTGAKQGA
jgi:multidrug resistance efflux pump